MKIVFLTALLAFAAIADSYRLRSYVNADQKRNEWNLLSKLRDATIKQQLQNQMQNEKQRKKAEILYYIIIAKSGKNDQTSEKRDNSNSDRSLQENLSIACAVNTKTRGFIACENKMVMQKYPKLCRICRSKKSGHHFLDADATKSDNLVGNNPVSKNDVQAKLMNLLNDIGIPDGRISLAGDRIAHPGGISLAGDDISLAGDRIAHPGDISLAGDRIAHPGDISLAGDDISLAGDIAQAGDISLAGDDISLAGDIPPPGDRSSNTPRSMSSNDIAMAGDLLRDIIRNMSSKKTDSMEARSSSTQLDDELQRMLAAMRDEKDVHMQA